MWIQSQVIIYIQLKIKSTVDQNWLQYTRESESQRFPSKSYKIYACLNLFEKEMNQIKDIQMHLSTHKIIISNIICELLSLSNKRQRPSFLPLSFMSLFIHHVFIAYYFPGAVLCPSNLSVNTVDEQICLHTTYVTRYVNNF